MLRFFKQVRATLRRSQSESRDWHAAKHAPILIFGGTQPVWDVLTPLFGDEAYEILHVDDGKPQMTFLIALWAAWYALRTRSVEAGYAIAFIRSVAPRIVVTFIDNNLAYQRAARHCRKTRFLAIQNGSRLVARDHGGDAAKIYHAEFACFGTFEAEEYKRLGATAERFYPIGSLKDAYYRAQIDGNFPRKRFDLCFVSQIKPQHYKIYPKTMASLDLLAQHLRRFCEAHGTTLCVAARRHPGSNPELFEWETDWYRERLGDRATIIPNVAMEYTSYGLIDASRVSLAMHTTLLREGFGRGNRILSCNFTGDPLIDFPIPGPWSLTDASYEVFERALLRLLNMTDEEYQSICGTSPQYLISYDAGCPTDSFLRNIISDAVQGAPRPAS